MAMYAGQGSMAADLAAAAMSSPTQIAQLNSSPGRYREAIQRAAAEGIGVLSPIQVMPVTPTNAVPFRELPLDPMPCQMQPAEGLQDASVRDDAPVSSQAAGQTGPSDAKTPARQDAAVEPDSANAAGQPAALPIECANLFPDIPPVPLQQYSFGLETQDLSGHDPVVVVSHGNPAARPWFSSVSSQQGFSYSGGEWTYRDTVGPTVAMGNLTSNAPVWGSTVPIGGLQVSSDWSQSQTLSEGSFAYSSAVGRLNYTDTTATTGAVDYGVTAGSGSLRYGLTPSLTLESQMQSAPNLSTHGVGTTYSAGEIGTFQAGATQSSFDNVNAWRYRFGYNVNLTESVSLAVTNEQIGAGFGDLSDYRGGAIGAPTMRNTLSAGVPLQGWGTLTGTYSGTRESGETVAQRFGLAHSMFIAPSVQLAVGADRDVISGDYEMNVGISMPVDAFMRGRWLPW